MALTEKRVKLVGILESIEEGGGAQRLTIVRRTIS
jgi:hypothetical protein